MPMVRIGETYRHFKGGTYKIIALGVHSETFEKMVVYEALYDNPRSKIWIRPLSMFEDEVEREGKKVKRFTLVSA